MLTPEARQRGLQKLRAMQKATGQLLNAIRAGANPIAPIENMDYVAFHIPLITYLRAVPGVGRKWQKEILSQLKVEPQRKIKRLSPAQRDMLVSLLKQCWRLGYIGGKHERTNETPTGTD